MPFTLDSDELRRTLIYSGIMNMIFAGTLTFKYFYDGQKSSKGKTQMNSIKKSIRKRSMVSERASQGNQPSQFSNPLSTLWKNKDIEVKNDFTDNHGRSEGSSCYRICVTGGPCAGKTTGKNIDFCPFLLTCLAMAEISKYFGNIGYTIYAVPETATLTMVGGGNIIVSLMPF